MVLTNRAKVRTSRSVLRAFGGLNETCACTEAEYSAGLNFSARDFPALSTRRPRRRLRDVQDVNGMYHLNGLLVVSGKSLLYTPDEAGAETLTLENAVTDGKKSLVGIGTRILIFPDKLAFDTASGTVAPLGAVWESGETTSVTLEPCDGDGKTYTVDRYGSTEPEDPADGELFLKFETYRAPFRSDGTLEVYNAASGNWSAIPLNFCRITAQGIGKDFSAYDTVTLSGSGAAEVEQWDGLDGERIVYDVGENHLVVKADPGGNRFFGSLVRTGSEALWQSIDLGTAITRTVAENVRVERRIPDLDYLTECDNRVWGCASGENVIYSCKLGDPTNWFSYRGIAADSYAVTVGSDGAFTGAATCMGYALFFKENSLHKLCGSKPSDFQLSSLRCRGVARNAAESLCVLNETLYYLSADGVMAWDGSLPVKVSTALDAARLSNVTAAAGGALDGRYYLHVERGDGSVTSARLLVYDTERGLWHEEDVCSYRMASTGGQLYFWDGTALWAADPSRERDAASTDGVEQAVRFELTSGDIGLDTAEDEYLSRLTLRLDAAKDTRLAVAASYDGGPWEPLAETRVDAARRCTDLSFVPRRCATLRLHLQGEGQLTLRTFARTTASARGGIIEQEE